MGNSVNENKTTMGAGGSQDLMLVAQLRSYNGMMMFIVVAIVLLIVIYTQNAALFNKTFGTEIVITMGLIGFITFMLRQIAKYNKEPTSSMLQNVVFNGTDGRPSLIGVYIAITIIVILGFLAMLKVAKVANEGSSYALWINLGLITIYGVCVLFFMSNYQESDKAILKQLSQPTRQVYEERFKWTGILIGIIVAFGIAYVSAPEFMSKYAGMGSIVTIFGISIIIGLLVVYQKMMGQPHIASSDLDKLAPFTEAFLKGIYVLIALIISGSIMFYLFSFIGIFKMTAWSGQNVGSTLFNMLLLGVLIGGVLKLMGSTDALEKNPVFKLIFNAIMYIPCIFIDLFIKIQGFFVTSSSIRGSKNAATVLSPMSAPSSRDIIMLIGSLVLIAAYAGTVLFLKPYLQKTYNKQGGEQLVNQPIETNKETNIATYQTLNGTDSLNYKYAISFWFYINSFAPSTSASYAKTVPILSFGETPIVKYNGTTNTLTVSIKHSPNPSAEKSSTLDLSKMTEWSNDKGKDTRADIENIKSTQPDVILDDSGHRIIYEQKGVLLQKWNHVVLNYDGGTFDVFYNGKLVRSTIEVVPYIKYDMLTVGSAGGVSGNVSNIIYFKHPLDVVTINKLYLSLKDKDPPCLDNDIVLVPLPTPST